jgi:cytochrome P450
MADLTEQQSSSTVLQRERAPVYDFDYYKDPRVLKDALGAYFEVKREAPPLFWTERNGGHWFVNAPDLAMEVLRNPQLFSSRVLSIPANPNLPQLIPQMLDPPAHRYYRNILRPFFESKAVDPVAPRVTELANEKIDAVVEQGHCEFVNGVGAHFALSVFMELYGFPLEQFDYIRDLEFSFFSKATNRDEQMQVSGKILAVIDQVIEARRAEPRNDWISTLIHKTYEGGKLTKPELMSISFMVFLAGLDTVVNALTFGMRHLAHDEAMRQRMIDDPDCIPAAVEELMRRYTFISLPRYVTADTQLGGITLSEGDSILVPLMLMGWDDRTNPDPETVAIDRPVCKHAGFGTGVHTCPGIHLARQEMAIFYRLWFEKVGHFREVESAERPLMRGGTVVAIKELHLAWDR